MDPFHSHPGHDLKAAANLWLSQAAAADSSYGLPESFGQLAAGAFLARRLMRTGL